MRCQVTIGTSDRAPAGVGGAHDEPEQPHHQDDQSHPPEKLEGEPGAEEDEREKQHKQKGNH